MAFPLLEAFSIGSKILDKIFPDPQKKAEAKILLQQAKDAGELQELNNEIAQEQERTKRQENDMKSDSWLSKNIRPMTLVYLLGAYTLLALFDGNLHWDELQFDVKAHYAETFAYMLFMAVGFYFTSRGLEKLMALFRGGK